MDHFNRETRPALAALAGIGAARRIQAPAKTPEKAPEIDEAQEASPAVSPELQAAAQQLQNRQPGASRRANNIQFAGQTPTSQRAPGGAPSRSAEAAKASAAKLAQYRANKDAERQDGGLAVDPAQSKQEITR